MASRRRTPAPRRPPALPGAAPAGAPFALRRPRAAARSNARRAGAAAPRRARDRLRRAATAGPRPRVGAQACGRSVRRVRAEAPQQFRHALVSQPGDRTPRVTGRCLAPGEAQELAGEAIRPAEVQGCTRRSRGTRRMPGASEVRAAVPPRVLRRTAAPPRRRGHERDSTSWSRSSSRRQRWRASPLSPSSRGADGRRQAPLKFVEQRCDVLGQARELGGAGGRHVAVQSLIAEPARFIETAEPHEPRSAENRGRRFDRGPVMAGAVKDAIAREIDDPSARAKVRIPLNPNSQSGVFEHPRSEAAERPT